MRRVLLLALAGATLAGPAGAQSRRHRATAYVELDQAVTADLTNDDTVTYAQAAVGVDAAVDSARAHAQVSYRYERQISETRRIGDADIHTGLARASYQVARPLTIEGGAIATRTRADIRGAAPAITDTANAPNVSQLYSLYAGPTLHTGAGPVAFDANYRFGYTRVEAPTYVALPAGAPRLDYFDSSTGHEVGAAASVAPGRVLPVGVTVSGGYAHEGAGQLDQRYDAWFGRGDALLPVSPTLALTAGVGWQRIAIRQRDAAVDAGGNPLLDAHGRFVTDRNSPARIAYRTDGLIYDAGVVWHPSTRTRLTATVAHQYDSTSYTGAFDWQVDRGVVFRAAAYDQIQTFGRQLRTGLQNLPTDFVSQIGGLGQQFNGCVFGGGGAAGGCLNDVFQSITTASYRARGVDAVLSASRGRNRFGIGAGYANRHLFAPRAAPGLAVYGLNDQSYYLQGFYGRQLGARSSFDANVFANWYDGGVAGSPDVFGAGATGAYTRSFGRLGATAQAGIYTYSQPGLDDQWTAQALLGARYQF